MNLTQGVLQRSTGTPEPQGQPRDLVDALFELGSPRPHRFTVRRGGQALIVVYAVRREQLAGERQ